MSDLNQAVRTTNLLLLAQIMGLDPTEPVQAQKILRYLDTVERYAGRSEYDE